MKLAIEIISFAVLFSFWVFMIAKRWIIPLVIFTVTIMAMICYLINGGPL